MIGFWGILLFGRFLIDNLPIIYCFGCRLLLLSMDLWWLIQELVLHVQPSSLSSILDRWWFCLFQSNHDEWLSFLRIHVRKSHTLCRWCSLSDLIQGGSCKQLGMSEAKEGIDYEGRSILLRFWLDGKEWSVAHCWDSQVAKTEIECLFKSHIWQFQLS